MQAYVDSTPPTDHARAKHPTVIISFRIDHADYLRLTEIIERSSKGYDSIGEYIRYLIHTQAFRQR